MRKLIISVILMATSMPCIAKGGGGYRPRFQITTTTEHIASITKEIAGSYGVVEYLANGDKNPYLYEPQNSDVTTLRKSKLIICNGLGMESRWLPELLYAADKQDSGMNYLDIAEAMSINKPNAYTPHFLLSKEYVLRAASIIADRLAKLDPPHADYYSGQLEAFKQSVGEKVIISDSYRNASIIAYDSAIASVAEKAGRTSTAYILRQSPLTELRLADLDEFAQKATQSGAKAILMDTWTPDFIVKLFEMKSRLPVILIPLSVKSGKGSGNIFKLLNTIQERIQSIPTND